MKFKNIQNLIYDRKIQTQFIKYVLVGGTSAVFELTLFTILRKVIYLNLSFSNIIAAVASTLLNFAMNKIFSFKTSSKVLTSLVLYLILFCLNTIFSTSAIILMTNLGIPDVLGKFITMSMITLWNFALYRKVVFR